MDLVSANSLTDHPPATFAGGQRRSQPTTGVLRPKKEESPEEDEEGTSKDVLRQSQADNEYFINQIQQEQAHRIAHTTRVSNAALNTAPKQVKQGRIRQPAQFPKGTPADFKAAAKERAS